MAWPRQRAASSSPHPDIRADRCCQAAPSPAPASSIRAWQPAARRVAPAGSGRSGRSPARTPQRPRERQLAGAEHSKRAARPVARSWPRQARLIPEPEASAGGTRPVLCRYSQARPAVRQSRALADRRSLTARPARLASLLARRFPALAAAPSCRRALEQWVLEGLVRGPVRPALAGLVLMEPALAPRRPAEQELMAPEPGRPALEPQGELGRAPS